MEASSIGPAVSWEQVDCPLCAARAETELLRVRPDGGHTYRLVRCAWRELGWQVTGMDFNGQVAAQVQQHFGFPVLTGSLPHRDVAAESFDVITMGAVLEHVHRPHEVIAAAVRALRPGGYLMVAVPNLD